MQKLKELLVMHEFFTTQPTCNSIEHKRGLKFVVSMSSHPKFMLPSIGWGQRISNWILAHKFGAYDVIVEVE